MDMGIPLSFHTIGPMSLNLFLREKLMAFKHCQYYQTIRQHLINNTVIPLNQFTYIFTGKFGDLTTCKGCIESISCTFS